MAESEELKSLLMKVKEESEKVALKLNIHPEGWYRAGEGSGVVIPQRASQARGILLEEAQQLFRALPPRQASSPHTNYVSGLAWI